jgi:hypothetical protein
LQADVAATLSNQLFPGPTFGDRVAEPAQLGADAPVISRGPGGAPLLPASAGAAKTPSEPAAISGAMIFLMKLSFDRS